MSDHHHYGYADERHDHRGEYADDRHDHGLDYAEKHHRHHDEESRVAGLREDLSGAESRIYDMDREIGEVLAELRQFKEAAGANLASLNEITAELADAVAADTAFAETVHDTLRDLTWCLGRRFRDEAPPAGWDPAAELRRLTGQAKNDDVIDDYDEPPAPEFDPGPEIDDQGGMSERPFLIAPDERPF